MTKNSIKNTSPNSRKLLGQFYTNKNIFNNPAFLEWWDLIPKKDKDCILEPFAGSNGIIKMLSKLDLIKDYKSYDIEPMDDNVEYQDTISNFPKNYSVIITNPPFLARNSAKRNNFTINLTEFSDLYELCVDLCLKNSKYLAVIIPESFITNQKIDKSRLYSVISLQEKRIFKDTEHPVCLALFVPEKTEDYKIYHNKDLIGYFNDIKELESQFLSSTSDKSKYKVFWHNPQGQIGLKTIDVTNSKHKLGFMKGELILPEEVNAFSRLRTRILIVNAKNNKPISKKESLKIIKELNVYLNQYRVCTKDVFLTAFKGLRTDNKYRRRLDFNKARLIVNSFIKCYNN